MARNSCQLSKSYTGSEESVSLWRYAYSISFEPDCWLSSSVFQANWAGFGGGFENRGTMYLDGSSVVGNRSPRSEGGGAGGENGDYGLLFVNNTNFSNNTAMEGGAGLNNAGSGKSYVINSTFAGNVGNIQNLANPFGGGAANTGTTTSGGTLNTGEASTETTG